MNANFIAVRTFFYKRIYQYVRYFHIQKKFKMQLVLTFHLSLLRFFLNFLVNCTSLPFATVLVDKRCLWKLGCCKFLVLADCYSSLGPMSSVQLFVISSRHFCILLIFFNTNACKANCTCRREFKLEKPCSLLCVLSSLCDILRPFSETRLFQIIFTFYIACLSPSFCFELQ